MVLRFVRSQTNATANALDVIDSQEFRGGCTRSYSSCPWNVVEELGCVSPHPGADHQAGALRRRLPAAGCCGPRCKPRGRAGDTSYRGPAGEGRAICAGDWLQERVAPRSRSAGHSVPLKARRWPSAGQCPHQRCGAAGARLRRTPAWRELLSSCECCCTRQPAVERLSDGWSRVGDWGSILPGPGPFYMARPRFAGLVGTSPSAFSSAFAC